MHVDDLLWLANLSVEKAAEYRYVEMRTYVNVVLDFWELEKYFLLSSGNITVPGGPGGPLRSLSQEGDSEPLSEWGPLRSKSGPPLGGSTMPRDADYVTVRVKEDEWSGETAQTNIWGS